MSLELPRGEDDSEVTLGDVLPYHEPGYELADARASLDRLLRTLCRRDREVLRLRFEEDLTQREIGRRMGVSQMHVSRIIRGAIEELGETAERLAPAASPRSRRDGGRRISASGARTTRRAFAHRGRPRGSCSPAARRADGRPRTIACASRSRAIRSSVSATVIVRVLGDDQRLGLQTERAGERGRTLRGAFWAPS